MHIINDTVLVSETFPLIALMVITMPTILPSIRDLSHSHSPGYICRTAIVTTGPMGEIDQCNTSLLVKYDHT